MASELVNHVTDANFDQEVLKSDKAVLIDFWAPWCAPCRAIAPLIDELAGEYAGRLKVVKINVDDNPETPARSSEVHKSQVYYGAAAGSDEDSGGGALCWFQ